MSRHESEVQPTIIKTDNEAGVLGRALSRVGNFLSDNKNKLTAAATAGVLTITLAGCGVAATEGGPKPETSRSDTPSPTPEETTASPDVLTANQYTDEQLMEMEMEPLPESLAPYKAMTVAEFEALPIEERLSYNSYLTRDQDYIETMFYEGYGENPLYLVEDEIDEESTAQQVITSTSYFTGNAFVSHFGGYVYDRDDQQKTLASGFYTASVDTNPQYKLWTDARSEADRTPTPTLAAGENKLQIGEAAGESPSYITTTPDGKEYFTRDITTKGADGGESTGAYILVDYVDYKGEEKQSYVLYEKK